MMARVNTQVSIEATPDKVFKYLAHLKYHYLWNPHLVYISSIKPLKLNVKYDTTSQILGLKIKANNIVKEFVKDKLIRIDNKTGMIHYTAVYKIHKLNNQKILLRSIIEVTASHKTFAYSAHILKVLAKRELQSDLSSLKIAVENNLK